MSKWCIRLFLALISALPLAAFGQVVESGESWFQERLRKLEIYTHMKSFKYARSDKQGTLTFKKSLKQGIPEQEGEQEGQTLQ